MELKFKKYKIKKIQTNILLFFTSHLNYLAISSNYQYNVSSIINIININIYIPIHLISLHQPHISSMT